MEARGSYALAREKRTLFEIGLQTCLDAIASALQRDVVKRLVELNGWKEELTPRVRLILPKRPNLDELVDIMNAVAKLGAPEELTASVLQLTHELLGLGGMP